MNQAAAYRKEKDFLGEKEIPADAYYGIQTLRAKENFPITGYRLHESLIRAVAMVKKAAALANMETGRLNPRLGNAIVTAAQEIIDGKWHDQFIVDPIQGGAGTSINMNANEVIANRGLELLGEQKGNYFALSPNTHVNMSQSTNDVFPTAIHIATLMLLDQLLETMKHMMPFPSVSDRSSRRTAGYWHATSNGLSNRDSICTKSTWAPPPSARD
jgi:aspartate ammonia-lyase